jgi:AcrR family transcriptional regulator
MRCSHIHAKDPSNFLDLIKHMFNIKRMFNKPPTRRQDLSRATDETYMELLRAAGEVFSELGYEAATIRKICDRAHKNIALVKYHFGDKPKLYMEVLRTSGRASQTIEDIRVALNQNAAPEEILRAAIKARLRSIGRDDLPSWHFRILMQELVRPTPIMRRFINEAARPIYDGFLKVIGEIIGLPVDHETTRLCANSIFGQMLLYRLSGELLFVLSPDLNKAPEQMEKVADHIADFSLAYLRCVRSGKIATSHREARKDHIRSNRVDHTRRHGI